MKFLEALYRVALRFEIKLHGMRPSLIFLVGFVFCVGFVMLPELLPAIQGRTGYVWSPVHSQNFRVGDLYYYGAWLKEVIDNGLPAYSPSAREMIGQPLIETWRFIGLALGAIPGYIVSDMRFVILVDYGLSAALFFSIGYFYAWTLVKNHWIGFLTGISVLFLTDRLWVPVGPYAGNILSFWQVAASMFSLVINFFRDIQSVVDYDLFGSTFRFINISLSGPVLLLYYLIATLAYKTENIKVFIALCLMAPFMAFSYPSHMVIAYSFLLTYAVVAFYRRKWIAGVSFVSIGIITLLFLEIVQYRQMLKELLTSSQLWNNIFASEKMVLVTHDFSSLASIMVTSKYLLTFLLMLFITRKKPFLRDVVVAAGFIAIPLSGIYLFTMPQLSTRFLGRGIDHLWFMLMAVIGFSFLYDKIRNANVNMETVYKRSGVVYSMALKGISVFSFALVLLFSGYAFGHIAAYTATNNSRFIAEETMSAYRWMDRNVPRGAQVATLDWEDITLLPIFTNVSLVLGHNIIDGRSPEDELHRYVDLYRFLGFSADNLEKMLIEGPRSVRYMRQPRSRERTPCLPEDLFEASQLMEGVLYFPYITKINDIAITGKANEINPEFKEYVLNLYKNAGTKEFLTKYNVEYVVLNNRNIFPEHIPGNAVLVFETGTRSIFKIVQN